MGCIARERDTRTQLPLSKEKGKPWLAITWGRREKREAPTLKVYGHIYRKVEPRNQRGKEVSISGKK